MEWGPQKKKRPFQAISFSVFLSFYVLAPFINGQCLLNGRGVWGQNVPIFDKDLQDVPRLLQRLHNLSDSLVARENLISARHRVFLFVAPHVQGETDARKVNTEEVRGEQEDVADELVVSHGDTVLYMPHGAKDHADLMGEKGLGGIEETNGGHCG